MNRSLRTRFFFLLLAIILCFPLTTFAQSWSSVVSGTQNDLNAIMFADDISGWICGDGGIIKNSTDGGSSWISQNSNTLLSLNDVDFYDGNTGWVVGNSGTILKTLNGGSVWATQSSNVTKHLYCVDALTSSIAFAGGESGTLLKTTDGGATWTDITTSTFASIFGIEFLDGATGWAIGTDQNGNRIVGKSSNGGTSFTIQKSGGNSFYRGMDFVDVFVGYVVGDLNTVEKTLNGGQTWTNYTPSGSWQGVSFTSYTKGWISGADGKIMRTDDGGANWSAESTPTDKILKDIFFYNSSLGWTVGTVGTILKYNPGTGINDPGSGVVLTSLYPNPANDMLNIEYTLAKAGDLSLRIIDITGRELLSRNDGLKIPGQYATIIPLDNRPAGLYIIQITQNGFSVATQTFVKN